MTIPTTTCVWPVPAGKACPNDEKNAPRASAPLADAITRPVIRVNQAAPLGAMEMPRGREAKKP